MRVHGNDSRGRELFESRTHPRAIAPTKTATECVSGSVGKNWESRIVGASADRAERQRGTPIGCIGSHRLTEFDGVRREMIGDWVLSSVSVAKT